MATDLTLTPKARIILERRDWSADDKVLLLRLADWAEHISTHRQPTMALSEFLDFTGQVWPHLTREERLSNAVLGRITTVLDIAVTVDLTRFRIDQ